MTREPNNIRTLIKSLSKPSAYLETVTRVSCIQTHVSVIFLTDSHAYKIKKPVDFGFLNFSTIDRRRFYCNEEVRLNRRLCPDIYEGVVELRDTPDGPAFHGQGAIIEYAVKMRRLPASRMLNRLVETGEADLSTMKQVAAVIAEFHHTTPTSAAVAEYGQPERILFNWQENFQQMLPFESATLAVTDRSVIQTYVESFVQQHHPLFLQRIADGYIRECDGDIHLENICLTNQMVYIFDCIEFNDRFRCCDTAADIAFLLMDLDYHRRHDLAKSAWDEYLARSRDHDALQLINFYKMYRAFVRGKVESFLLNDPNIALPQREAAINRARRYFRLVRGYIEQERLQPTLFITCGVMGCGKSTLATELAGDLGIACFSSDQIRKDLHGIAPDSPVHVPYNSGLYSPAQNDLTYRELLVRAEMQLQGGKSVIIDASFIRRHDRALFRNMAEQSGVPAVMLHLQCKPAEQKLRLQKRSTHKAVGTASDGRVELIQSQQEAFEPPLPEEGFIISLDSTLPLENLLSTIYNRIAAC